MGLIIDYNKNLYSIKGSVEGTKKLKSAISEAIDNILTQQMQNEEREAKGLKPLPCQSVIKDEYGKEIVSIKETKNLEEIRKEYSKNLENLTYEEREKNLLTAMDEVGNSKKDEYDFKEQLAKQLNSALFVIDAELTPGLEKILDFFGDTKGMFNSINFKEEISQKCIKDLIDLPNPDTGKPPKTFEQLFSNIVSVNEVFKGNPNREKYIDLARSYINISYKFLIPKKYKDIFGTRGGLEELLNYREKQKINNIKNAEFEVSEKNFKQMYKVFSQFKNFKVNENPLYLANYLLTRVPQERKESVSKWLKSQGCIGEEKTKEILSTWAKEAALERKQNNPSKSKSDDSGIQM